jgi:hypothetical protein
MLAVAEKKEDQVNAPMGPQDKAVFRAIAEEDGRPIGQLARLVLLRWMKEWLSSHPEEAEIVREKAKLDHESRPPPDRPKSGERKRVARKEGGGRA